MVARDGFRSVVKGLGWREANMGNLDTRKSWYHGCSQDRRAVGLS